jgi:T5SS/PEP-CTERM-associated repeat protein
MVKQPANTGKVHASQRMLAVLLASTALVLAAVVPASAAEWVNPGTGSWFDPTNWALGSVPTSSDTSFVGSGGTAQVTGGGDASSGIVAIGTELSSGTVQVSGAGSTLTIGSDLFLGDYSVGTLNVSDGGVVSVGSTGHIGYNTGSIGAATVSGAGSTLSMMFLELGFAGGGTIDVTNGGTLQSQSSDISYGPYGKVVVDGAGSSWSSGRLAVGVFGDGAVDITNGGAVTSSYAHLASRNYSKGSVLVDGIGSSWTINDDVSIAHQGQGTLTISNGGVVSSGSARVASFAQAARGVVTVDGAGSRFDVVDNIYIGLVGDGTVTIANGGAVSAREVKVGGTGKLVIGAVPEEEAVAAGTLDADSIDLDSATARLVFNHTDADYRFDTAIEGIGVIELSGPGRTVLTGDSRDFNGKISLVDGELVVDGWLGGDMISKGRLSGTGIVRNVSVIGGGVIAPGHDDIGTLAVEGNLYMGPGSTYEVEITSGSSDLIQVTGIAYVDGADMVVKRGAGPLPLGAGYVVLSAGGGFFGSFGEVISDYAFVSPELELSSDGVSDLVTLEFNRNAVAFADVAKTANQASAAAALDGLGTDNAAHNTILSLNEAEAQALFDMLSGEGHATLKGVLMDNAGLVSDALLQRLDAARTLDASGAASGYAALPVLPEDGGGNAIWGQFYGGLGERSSDGNAASAASSSGGLLLGADAAVGDWQVGLAAQVGQTEVSIADRATEATTAEIGGSFYAGTNWGDTGFSIAGVVVRHAISTSREVGLGLNETLTADYGAITGQVVAELEHEVDFGAASLIPYAQVGHTVQATEAFTETGNGAGAALSGGADVVGQSFATLGVRGAYQFVVGQGGLATFSGGIGWRRGFGEAPTAQLGFNGGSPFVIAATPAAADSLQLEAGLDFDLATGLDFSLNYSGEANAGGQSHALRAGLGGQF